MENFDVVILGAGAAGLMCAISAGSRGKRVVLLDHADRAGAKILISGGGRCNFTNLHVAPERYLSANPHFCKSALQRYTQHDFIALINRHKIPFHEKTLGQLFCDGAARDIVAMLLAECEAACADVRLGVKITDISHSGRFRIETSAGGFEAASLVLATGGPSMPKMGATGFAYEVARRFGLAVREPRPGLVPLTARGKMLAFCSGLAGIPADAIASCGKQQFRENILFTHRGLSGPAILQISSYWREGQPVTLDLAPDVDMADFFKRAKRSRPKAAPKTVLAEILPARLAAAMTGVAGNSGAVANLSDKAVAELSARVKRWEFTPAGSEGFAKAEVTLGGIDVDGLSSKTMEANAVPGLYCIGEAVDVTGWLGGYNFQWAWSSGWCAGQAVA